MLHLEPSPNREIISSLRVILRKRGGVKILGLIVTSSLLREIDEERVQDNKINLNRPKWEQFFQKDQRHT